MRQLLSSPLRPENLVDRSVAQRHKVQVTVRACMHVGAHAEVPADEQRFAFRDLPLVQVVGNAVREARIIGTDRTPVARQIEVEEVSTFEKRTCGRHEEVSLELCPELAA